MKHLLTILIALLTCATLHAQTLVIQGTNWTWRGTSMSDIKGEWNPPPSNYWTEVSGLPVAREGLAAATIGTNIYAMCGMGGGTMTNVYKFNGSIWTGSAGLPFQPRWEPEGTLYLLAAATIGTDMYVIGGYNSWADETTTNVYKFDGSTWTEVAGLPAARLSLAAATIGTNMYAIGGAEESGITATNKVYKFDGSTWTEVAGLPAPREELAAATIGTNIYAIGGSYYGVAKTNVYKYDGSVWTEVAGLPVAKKLLAAATIGANIYAIGGSNSTNVYRFDGSTWEEVAGLPAARDQLAAATIGANAYAIGGSNSTNVYKYTP